MPTPSPEPNPTRTGSPGADPALSRTADAPATVGPVPPAPPNPALYDFLAPPKAPGELGRLGKYRVLGVVGQGGMGVVFRAEDTALRREVALKVMLPHQSRDPVAKARFLREARAAAAVEHDHILPIHTVDEDRGLPFIAMPLLRGIGLGAALRLGRPPLPELLRVGREIAEGLSAAHAKGLVHRDIKPGNVWLEGDRRRVKILDFGLARDAAAVADGSDGPLTWSGTVLGTPAYMSPEQANGQPVDARTDLFSLGVILYEMAAGRRPFQGATTYALMAALAVHHPPPPHTLAADCPPELSTLVMALLAKDPAGRPGSAAWVAAELGRIELTLSVMMTQPVPLPDAGPDPWAMLETVEPTAAVAAPPAPPPRPRRKVPLAWAAAGAAVLAAAVGVGLVVRGGKPADGSAKADEPPATTRPGSVKRDDWIDLLKEVDPARDAIRPAWERRAGVLAKPKGGHELIEFPYRPGAEYDFEVEFTRTSGNKMIYLVAPRADGPVSAYLAYDDTGFGVGSVRATGPKIENNRQHVVRVEVRADRVTARLDGKVFGELPAGDTKRVGGSVFLPRDRRRLAFGAHEPVLVQRAAVRELRGGGGFDQSEPAGDEVALYAPGAGSVSVPTLKLDPAGPFTVEGYFTRDDLATGYQNVFVLSDMASMSGFKNWTLKVHSGGAAFYAVGPAVVPNERVHVAGVFDGRAARVFVNGRLSGEKVLAPPGPLTPARRDLTLLEHFSGRAHGIRISSTARYERDFAPPATLDPDDDTLALYRCDDGQGTQLTDSSGNEHHGIIYRGAWVRTGPAARPGGGFALVSSAKTVVRVPTLLLEPTAPVTVEGYFRPDPAAGGVQGVLGTGLVGLYAGGSAFGADSWAFNVFANKQDNVAAGRLVPGRWVHVAGVSDGKAVRLYLDGKLARETAVKPFGKSGKSDPVTLCVGYTGALDEVRVSKTARYAADFTPAPRLAPDRDTLALYHCDDGGGDRLTDSSGNNHHGQIANGGWEQAAGPAAPDPRADRGPPADLLRRIDPAADAVRGAWERTAAGLAATGEAAALQTPYHPPAEYDCAATLRFGPDGAAAGLVVPFGDRGFRYWVFTTGNKIDKGWRKGPLNTVTSDAGTPLDRAAAYRLRIEVRATGIRVFLEGKLIDTLSVETLRATDRYSNLRDDAAVGLFASGAGVTFEQMVVTEYNGRGTFTRPDATNR